MNPDSIVDFERWLDQQCSDAQRLASMKAATIEEAGMRKDVMLRRWRIRRYVKVALLTYGRACAIAKGDGHVSSKA